MRQRISEEQIVAIVCEHEDGVATREQPFAFLIAEKRFGSRG
jgi:hypothetical protein